MLPKVTEAGMSQAQQCNLAAPANRSAGQPPSLAGLGAGLVLSLLPGDTLCWAAEDSRSVRLCACPGDTAGGKWDQGIVGSVATRTKVQIPAIHALAV